LHHDLTKDQNVFAEPMTQTSTAANPEVSIIIPNYNYAQFLDERFKSILAQGFTNYEIIFLDDASGDESVALARERYGDRIKVLEVNHTNSGNPFVQWNRGVRLARGEFIWIAEADDICSSDFLAHMLEAINQSKTIGIAYCTTVPINTKGEILDIGFHQRYLADLDPDRWYHNFVANGRDEVKRYLGRKNTITNVSGVIFRRKAYVAAGFAPEGLRMCGDWLTYCSLLHDWDVAFVSAPLNYHRQHPSKHTQNSVLNLTYFQEFLKVQEYVAKSFNLSKPDRDEAFRRFLREWDRLTISSFGRIGLSRNLALARMAANSYREPIHLLRIAAHLVANSSKSMAGKWLIH
jgi:glycosyltransferase involved in cell wall biosynthesis